MKKALSVLIMGLLCLLYANNIGSATEKVIIKHEPIDLSRYEEEVSHAR